MLRTYHTIPYVTRSYTVDASSHCFATDVFFKSGQTYPPSSSSSPLLLFFSLALDCCCAALQSGTFEAAREKSWKPALVVAGFIAIAVFTLFGVFTPEVLTKPWAEGFSKIYTVGCTDMFGGMQEMSWWNNEFVFEDSIEVVGQSILNSYIAPLFFQNALQAKSSGFEMCFGPSTLLGCWGQNTFRIQNKEVYAASYLQATLL